ncbi:hypothetical protein FACS189413_08410 [Bacteroidia bacterium]|nr:hypothetical protein FACS189413_08410 [Bacteroidia bacterium]
MRTTKNNLYAQSTMESGDHFKNGASLKSQKSKGNFLIWLFFAFTIVSTTTLMTSCEKVEDEDEDEVTVPIAVTDISLDKTTLTLVADNDYTLKATVLPANATDKTVTWTSSNTNVATVTQQGKVTAVTAGTVTITAEAGNKAATCEVTVPPVAVTGISLDKTSLTLFYITSLSLRESYALTTTVLPANASGNPITWTSSNKNVATIDQGKVAATGAGTVTITAIAGDKTATCDVTVSNDISQIKISNDINGFTINGVTWATRNVDAPGNFAAKPEDPGKFYQWNNKIAWPATGAVSGWVNADILASEWADENDPSPNGWRVPTLSEIRSLEQTNPFILSGSVGSYCVFKMAGDINAFAIPLSTMRSAETGILSYDRSHLSWTSTIYPGTTEANYGWVLGINTNNPSVRTSAFDKNAGLPIRSVKK